VDGGPSPDMTREIVCLVPADPVFSWQVLTARDTDTNLFILDPIWTTASVTLNHGYLI